MEQLDITDKFRRKWYMIDFEGIWPSLVGEFQKTSFILKLNKIYSNFYNSPIFEHI